MNTFSNPVQVTFGSGSLDRFLSEIREINGNVLLVTGNKSISGIEQGILNALSDNKVFRINRVSPNPDISHIYENYKSIPNNLFSPVSSNLPNSIVAVGGGSVIDMAKSLKSILGSQLDSVDSLRDVIQNKTYTPLDCSLIVCPTSAGTGSEVTKWATVWDSEKQLKYSIEHDNLYAYKAYIDSVLTESLPIKQAVSCAFDAFSHAIESYWSPKSCPISREYSIKAIELFESTIDRFSEKHGSEEREIMSLCGYFAGLAFSHTRTTVCHAISYPLTMEYNIPHGIAACISVPLVLQINSNSITDKKRLFNALNISTPGELTYKIRKQLTKAQIPHRLEDYGFNKSDIDIFAKKCITPGRSDNNPVKVDVDDIKEILNKL